MRRVDLVMSRIWYDSAEVKGVQGRINVPSIKKQIAEGDSAKSEMGASNSIIKQGDYNP